MNLLVGVFKSPCRISINFVDGGMRKQVPLRQENGETKMVPLFRNLESIVGEVVLEPNEGMHVKHNGVRLELLGQIELSFDKGIFYNFTSLVCDLDASGEISERKTYPFEFSTVELPYETYNGLTVSLRYILKATISRVFLKNIVECQDFAVHHFTPFPSIDNVIQMVTVGPMSEFLKIGFVDFKSKYHLEDAILGKVYFLVVRIKIKKVELGISRRESTGSGVNAYDDRRTLAKFELINGTPVAAGDSVNCEFRLSPYKLTPTYCNIHNKFSVKYYWDLEVVDEEDRKYIFPSEVVLYRLESS